jgi:hypothetical protein
MVGRVSIAMAVAASLAIACGKKAEPVSDVTASAASAPSASGSAKPASAGSASLGGNVPFHEPEWVLDPQDPARDYVSRYITGTNRYGAQTGCVEVQKAVFKGESSAVAVKNDPSGSCGPAGAVRDTFLVNVSGNRMTLDDPTHHDPLQKWPDGSDPDGPPGPVVSVEDLRSSKVPLKQTMKELQLVPLRIQLYGRGTYPVVTLAGWHDPVFLNAQADALRPVVTRLCDATSGRPLGVFAGLDRVNLLRIDCPDKPRWDRMR